MNDKEWKLEKHVKHDYRDDDAVSRQKNIQK